MQPHTTPLMYEQKRPRTKQIVVGVTVLLLGTFWVVQTLRRGSFTASPEGATYVTASRPSDGERDVLPNAFVEASFNSGQAIDPESVDAGTVKLYRAGDKQLIAAQITLSAGGDAITLTPLSILEPGTKYTFELKGVKDVSGADVLPYDMTFTTTGGATTTTYPVAFEKVSIANDHSYYTGLTIGPDNQLYAGTVDGKIVRRRILDDGQLGESQVITTVQSANSGPRLITGIRFDPKSTHEKLVLWVSHGQFIMNEGGEPSLVGAEEWTGKISVVSGPELAAYRDVVVGLPRSWRDHLNNQLDFGPDGCIYFTQGSHTAMGAPDKKWGGSRVERVLSAAVLRLDPSKVSGASPFNVKTRDGGGTYDPSAPDAPLTIFATGVRVGYDMLWHANGHLYTATNGSAAGGNTPGGKGAISVKNVPDTQPDLLLRIEKGGYYGHPNPLRGEHVLNGGNPTSARDPFEITGYPAGTQPDHNWRKPVYSFGTGVSPNGMIEYQSDGQQFGGALDGKLLVTRFSGGKDIIVIDLDKDGNVVESITGIAGLTSFTQPLDLTQDRRTGCIYVAEYGGEKLSLLRPISDPDRMAQVNHQVFRQQVRGSQGAGAGDSRERATLEIEHR